MHVREKTTYRVFCTKVCHTDEVNIIYFFCFLLFDPVARSSDSSGILLGRQVEDLPRQPLYGGLF